MLSLMSISRRNLLRYAAVASPLAALSPVFGGSQLRASVGAASILRFIPTNLHQGILNGSSNRDLSRYIQNGVESGENLFFPGNATSKYAIDGQIQIRNHAQYLSSSGLIRLDFLGQAEELNAIELLSGRRDGLSPSQTRQAQSIAGFRITGPEDAKYGSMIFVEEGTFFPRIERIFSEAGTNRGYRGSLADSFLRVHGTTKSYVNDVTIRDCVFAGVRNAGNPRFPKCGIWIEGCIEGRVENTKVFYFDECMRLGNADSTSRNVQFMVFDQVQLEPTKPNDQVNRQAALNIFLANACNFRDCRFAVGNGPTRVNSVAVRVSGTAKQLRFRDCSFQGFRRAQTLLEISENGKADGIFISGADIRDFIGDLTVNHGSARDILFEASKILPPS